MIKVGISHPSFYREFKPVFPSLEIIHEPKDVAKYDLILFPGGEDVSPFLYGEDQKSYSGCSRERDLDEKKVYDYASQMNKKMLGICRGSQFLNVMRGGSLYQDITYEVGYGHPYLHKYNKLRNHKILSVVPDMINSTHHQGIKEPGRGLRIIADYLGVPEITVGTEDEILLLQFHPESMNGAEGIFRYINSWVSGEIVQEKVEEEPRNRRIPGLKSKKEFIEMFEKQREQERAENMKKAQERVANIRWEDFNFVGNPFENNPDERPD